MKNSKDRYKTYVEHPEEVSGECEGCIAFYRNSLCQFLKESKEEETGIDNYCEFKHIIFKEKK